MPHIFHAESLRCDILDVIKTRHSECSIAQRKSKTKRDDAVYEYARNILSNLHSEILQATILDKTTDQDKHGA